MVINKDLRLVKFFFHNLLVFLLFNEIKISKLYRLFKMEKLGKDIIKI